MKNKIIEGTLRTNPRGFGFVVCLDKKTKDVFIPKSEMKNAIDGDIVEVQIKNITSKGLDGSILKILKREKINGRIQDKTKHSPQINWETKDKHILNYLYTEKAKQIAKNRMIFSENFFKRLENEINGKI